MAERIEKMFHGRVRSARQLTRISLREIVPNPAQPRRAFSENAINDLAASIRQYGLLSPLIVRRMGPGRFELIAGERRLRALRLLGETETDAVVLSADSRESALIALVENLQRENLNFFEEAEACHSLLTDHHLTRDELAARLGKSPSALANRLRLLKLSPAVRAGVTIGGLTERHARALLRLPDEAMQQQALERAVRLQLTVRALDQTIDRMLHEAAAPRPAPRIVCRDHRLFVNAMLDAVRTLQQSGSGVTSRVTDRPDGVEITVLIPRAPVSDAPHSR